LDLTNSPLLVRTIPWTKKKRKKLKNTPVTSPVLVAAVDPFDAEAALHQLFPQQNTE
jgi:hypothetical protein